MPKKKRRTPSTKRNVQKRLAISNTSNFKVEHDASTGRCRIFNESGEIIVQEQEEVARVSFNFAEERVSVLTAKSMLITYDLQTGNLVSQGKYNGGIIAQV